MKLDIGYFADGPWSHHAFQKLVKDPDISIKFICVRFETKDEILKQYAAQYNVDYLMHKNINSKDFIQRIAQYNCNLFVSMSFNQILKKDIIAYAPKGFINCHAGALPFYRGRNPLNWVLINGENTFGITVHYVDEGIDTGDIIEQKHYPISTHDTYSRLLNIAVTECGQVLFSAMQKLSQNKVKRIKQKEIHPVGTYFGRRTFGDEILNFTWPSFRVFNFIRAISSPGPGARFWVENTEYAIEEAVMISEAPTYIATEGEILGRDIEGVVVKTGDSSLRIKKIRQINDAGETTVSTPTFRVGVRLKSEPKFN